MKDKLFTILKISFYSLIGIFSLILGYFIIPAPENIKQQVFPIAAVLAVIFFIIGVILIVLTIKLRLEKTLRIFLILTGGSAAGFLIFTLLHNFFYGLSIIAKNIIFLTSIMEALHVTSFIISTWGCPIGFLVGVIGTIFILIKHKK